LPVGEKPKVTGVFSDFYWGEHGLDNKCKVLGSGEDESCPVCHQSWWRH
jgi:hypothetical protein